MKKVTIREALCEALYEEMVRDHNVFIIGEEVAEYQGAYKVTQGLFAKFGSERVIDTPISEHGLAGLGVGAAFVGLRPVVEFMTFNFAMQAIDQIINSAAKTSYMSGGKVKCPIVFRGPNGAASRVGAQHSQCYASWYAHIPGLKVIAPYSADDCKGLLKAAIRDPGPVIFLENEILYGRTHEICIDQGDVIVPIGKARIRKEGNDITIVSFSIGIEIVTKASEILDKDFGISVEIIDLRTIRPIDAPTIIASVQKTSRLITVEEGWGFASVGAGVVAQINGEIFDYLDAPILNITGKDVPLPYVANLERLALPSVEDVVNAVKTLCNYAT